MYIIETPTDILNTIGAFYEKINAPLYYNANSELKRKVDARVAQITNKFKNNTDPITVFSDNNPSHQPKSSQIQFSLLMYIKRTLSLKIFLINALQVSMTFPQSY